MDSQAIFHALADRTRQRLLTVLGTHELAVSELVEVMRQPQSTVSRHLKILRSAGLIRDVRHGTTVNYSVNISANSASEARDGLSGRILDWASDQPLDAAMRCRLDAVLDHRRAVSDRFFTQLGRQWDALREEAFGRTFQIEALLTLLPREWVVADIGTGTGYLLPVLARHFRRVIGVDPVGAMLKAASERVERFGVRPNVSLKEGDLSRLPIRGATVDLVLSFLVLHHVPDPHRALAEMCRITRAGGRVLIVEQALHENESFRERMQDRRWGFDADDLVKQLTAVGVVQLHHSRLATVEPAADAPELFAVTGVKEAAIASPQADTCAKRRADK